MLYATKPHRIHKKMKTTSELCELLPWDTEFFNHRIARIIHNTIDSTTIGEILQLCQKNKVECLYFLTEADDLTSIRVAEENNFHLVQIRVTLEKDIENWTIPPTQALDSKNQTGIRSATMEDIDALGEIGRSIFTYARFYNDPCFPVEKSQKLYETWTRKSVQGYTDQVLVLASAAQILGFVTCRVDRENAAGKIELIGLRADAQGNKFGQKLMLSAMEWFKSQQLKKVFITTQGANIAMQRVSQRLGFVTSQIQLYYHKWFINCHQANGT